MHCGRELSVEPTLIDGDRRGEGIAAEEQLLFARIQHDASYGSMYFPGSPQVRSRSALVCP